MEFQQVLGIRRSIRYFEPDKPVEQEKIQKILEAMRIASCAVNAHWLKAVVVKRHDISAEDLEKMKNPVQANVIALAPVHIYLYGDPGVVNKYKGRAAEAALRLRRASTRPMAGVTSSSTRPSIRRS